LADVDTLDQESPLHDFREAAVIDLKGAVRFSIEAVEEVHTGEEGGKPAAPGPADAVDDFDGPGGAFGGYLEVVCADNALIERFDAQGQRVARGDGRGKVLQYDRRFLREAGDRAGIGVVDVQDAY